MRTADSRSTIPRTTGTAASIPSSTSGKPGDSFASAQKKERSRRSAIFLLCFGYWNPVPRRTVRLKNSFEDGHMGILAWIVVGLVAGVLASLVMGGTGYGIIGDIVIGIVGAFIGGWLFSALGISTPFGGMGGTIFVAFIGAVVLLFILRLIRGSTRRI